MSGEDRNCMCEATMGARRTIEIADMKSIHTKSIVRPRKLPSSSILEYRTLTGGGIRSIVDWVIL